MTQPAAREPGQPYRIALIDDHGLCRRGLAELLEVRAGVNVVGTTASADEAVALEHPCLLLEHAAVETDDLHRHRAPEQEASAHAEVTVGLELEQCLVELGEGLAPHLQGIAGGGFERRHRSSPHEAPAPSPALHYIAITYFIRL